MEANMKTAKNFSKPCQHRYGYDNEVVPICLIGTKFEEKTCTKADEKFCPLAKNIKKICRKK